METASGPEQYGCVHYKRKYKIRALCCGEVFDRRHCHNEANDSLDVSFRDRDEIPRREIKLIVISLGPFYFSESHGLSALFATKDRMYDRIAQIMGHASVSKNQFHCKRSGICRTGGAENFFHCDKCGCCYSYVFKDSQQCIRTALYALR